MLPFSMFRPCHTILALSCFRRCRASARRLALLPAALSAHTRKTSQLGRHSVFHEPRFTRHKSLSPIESPLTKNAPITRLESALPKSQHLKPFRICTYEKTRWEGGKLLTRHPTKGVCPERPSGARDLSAVRITGHCSAQFTNLPTVKHFNAAFRLLTAHYPLPTVSQRTANSQPPTYGIIPPHVPQSGRIQ